MSNELVSMTLAMVSESREVNTILKELFTPEGNELYVHPASRYLRYVKNFGCSQALRRFQTVWRGWLPLVPGMLTCIPTLAPGIMWFCCTLLPPTTTEPAWEQT